MPIFSWRLATPCPHICADEIDAVGTKRYDAHSGGEREIQRTMLELLNQLDGFDSMHDVKVRGGAAERARERLGAQVVAAAG